MIIVTHSEVHSASDEGSGTLVTQRPFRAPHHAVSSSGLAGCASNLRMQMLTVEDLLRSVEGEEAAAILHAQGGGHAWARRKPTPN